MVNKDSGHPVAFRNLPRRRSMVIALAAYAAWAGFFIGANPWEPLAGILGVSVLLGASLALGLLGGRRRVLLAALVLIPLVPLSRAPEPAMFVALALPVLVLLCATLIALGLGLRALARRRSEGAGTRARSLGVGLLVIAGALTTWGVYVANRVIDHAPKHPVLVDVGGAAYEGVSLGATSARARRLLGNPTPGGESIAPSPLGVGPTDVSGPGAMPDWHTWRYRDLVVFTDRGRVRGLLTTHPDAETPEGVGVGDSLAIAKRAYVNLRCTGVTLGSDATNPSYPACEGRLLNGAAIWLGGDPIDSVWLTENFDHIPNAPIRPR